MDSKTTGSQPLGKTSAKPHNSYREEVRCQSSREWHLRSGRTTFDWRRLVIDTRRFRLDVHPGCHIFVGNDGRQRFRYLGNRIWIVVSWTFFSKAIFIVRYRVFFDMIPRSASRSIPRFFLKNRVSLDDTTRDIKTMYVTLDWNILNRIMTRYYYHWLRSLLKRAINGQGFLNQDRNQDKISYAHLQFKLPVSIQSTSCPL